MYHSVAVPSISVTEYLRRHLVPHGLYRKEHLLEAYILHTVVIVDRLILRNSLAGFHLCKANVHRVLLVASVISCQMLDDAPYNNAWWARVGGVSVEHLNELELFTVRALDHRLCVSAAEVAHAREALMSATNETAEAG